MTDLEAITAVEEVLAGLQIPDPMGAPVDEFGNPVGPAPLLTGIEVAGLMAQFFGEKWDRLVDGFASGTIAPDAYVAGVKELAREYDRFRFRMQVERRLSQLEAG